MLTVAVATLLLSCLAIVLVLLAPAAPSGGGPPLPRARLSHPVRPASLKGNTEEVNAVALSADGQVALMASHYRGVFLWDLTELADIVADPLETSCDEDRDTISRADWERFAGGPDWAQYGGEGLDFLSVCLVRWS
ncbi:hypothetical protein [Nonomuraea polychroma]|uniref:hypothetical protein n=1 Tax=Nonomuraea polychroma TaxID=46176 RepID=UPI000FDE648C|nr:hypothetical protein [Nonomuraea polychroma]